jgi:hypothetical protein
MEWLQCRKQQRCLPEIQLIVISCENHVKASPQSIDGSIAHTYSGVKIRWLAQGYGTNNRRGGIGNTSGRGNVSSLHLKTAPSLLILLIDVPLCMKQDGPKMKPCQ